jgi:hypothetical protein
VAQSTAFANILEQLLHDRVPLATPPIDRAPLRVLESANMPAVLLELGYLTNPDQEKLIASERVPERRRGFAGRSRCPFPRYVLERRRRDAMTRQRALIVGGIAAAAAALAWVLFVALPRRAARSNAPSAAAAPTQAPAGSGRKIKARLFYVAQDGIHLTHVERDVPYGEGTLEQAREIVAAQMAPVSQPLLSAIPAGTTVRALFLSEAGDAYVDFQRETCPPHRRHG